MLRRKLECQGEQILNFIKATKIKKIFRLKQTKKTSD